MRVSNRKSNRRGFLDFSIKVRVLSVGSDERVRVAIASRQLQKALHSIARCPNSEGRLLILSAPRNRKVHVPSYRKLLNQQRHLMESL
jgi:hypothetical protein